MGDPGLFGSISNFIQFHVFYPFLSLIDIQTWDPNMRVGNPPNPTPNTSWAWSVAGDVCCRFGQCPDLHEALGLGEWKYMEILKAVRRARIAFPNHQPVYIQFIYDYYPRNSSTIRMFFEFISSLKEKCVPCQQPWQGLQGTQTPWRDSETAGKTGFHQPKRIVI